jgi:FMN phosphatase YigB (HAD superfamily)
MASAKIKGIIFDRDNTLLYFDQAKIAGLQQKFNELVPDLDFYGLMAYWDKRDGNLPTTIAEEKAFWHDFWLVEVPAKFNLDPKQTEKLLELEPFYYSVYTPFPETIEVLGKLASKGLKLAILTNFELPNVAASLSESGIDPQLFDSQLLFNKTMTGFAKPDPRAYQHVLEKMQLPASEVLFIDDEPENVAAAEKLGMVCYLIDRKGRSNVKSIKSLVELETILLS